MQRVFETTTVTNLVIGMFVELDRSWIVTPVFITGFYD